MPEETPVEPPAADPGPIESRNGTIPDSGPQNGAPRNDGLQALRAGVRDLVIALLIIIFVLFVYQPVKVEGGSMEPGLEDQERIFINKLVYRVETIDRSDIVVFRYPRDPRKSFIKRVIAVPGDRIRIVAGHVYVNDHALVESYVPDEFFDARSYSEIVVKPDTYFVMGDHRSASNDSREFGPVPRANIYGKAVFGYWPMEKLGTVH
jgi:signal peptidase I